MRATIVGLLLLQTLLSLAEVSVNDDHDQLIKLPHPAQRIISLAPHLTEDLFAIGAGARIVGTVSYSDYPAQARTIPLVGSYQGLDLERIRVLRPDLIVAWSSGNSPQQMQQLESLGIRVFFDDSRSLVQVPTVLERLGVMTGLQAQADQAAGKFRQKLLQLQKNYAHRRPVRVFYQVWEHPLMTINGEQIISDAMRICGAVNVFSRLPALVPIVNDEAVIAANPDMIITSSEPSHDHDELARWKQWPNMTAVRHRQLIVLPPDLLNRLGPRLVDGTERLCLAVNQARQYP